MSRDIEARILKLENKLFKKLNMIPGTIIERELKPYPQDGYYWCVSIGIMNMPKQYFHGNTISEALTEAEKYYE